MAQHDFVPAWLNFATPQPAKGKQTGETQSPAASLEKHGNPHHHRDSRAAVSRRRHNSSDGFFNNGPLHAPAGDGGQQPSLLRHDSVDSGVAKGGHGGLAGVPCWKEAPPTWHGAPRGAQDGHHHPGRHPKRTGPGGGDRDRQGGHRQRNGNFHPRKGTPGTPYQDKFPNEERSRDDKLKFVEEDFPFLNPETTGKSGNQMRPVAPHAGVWENPPSGKQMVSKMLVIKKVSKEDTGCTAFSASFASSGTPPINSSKALPTIASSTHSVYKNLVPKPALVTTKPHQWKPSGRDSTKPGLHLSGRDSVFTSPVSAAKPYASATATQLQSHNTPKEQHPSSTTPPIDIGPSSRLKLMRRGPDRKSDILRTLKDECTGNLTSSSSSSGTPVQGESSTPEPKAYSQGFCHENGLSHSHSLSNSDTDHLSSSLEAEHRLLKAMGWQEYPENDDSFLPLTEDELREFQTKTEQMKRNGVLPRGARGVTLHFTTWRCVAEAHLEEDEGSESETSSSSQTSDDDDVGDCIKT